MLLKHELLLVETVSCLFVSAISKALHGLNLDKGCGDIEGSRRMSLAAVWNTKSCFEPGYKFTFGEWSYTSTPPIRLHGALLS